MRDHWRTERFQARCRGSGRAIGVQASFQTVPAHSFVESLRRLRLESLTGPGSPGTVKVDQLEQGDRCPDWLQVYFV